MMLRPLSLDEARQRKASIDALPDVNAIVEAVRVKGDAAVARFARRFGDPQPRAIERHELKRSYAMLRADARASMERAANRIAAFAEAQRSSLRDVVVRTSWGEVGHALIPVRRAGAYVPAGRYPLPSSMLMTVIPARVAGVSEVVACTPSANEYTCAAAYIAGADRVFEIGGAQAIAALAYGTQTIPRVDIIAGPGNAYVTAAKRAVSGSCGIDGLAGPSEVCIVAFGDADARAIALDLLAQAEHDVDARAMLVTDDISLAEKVERELAAALCTIRGYAVARASLERNGWYCLCTSEDAVDLVNELAPEHLELHGTGAELLRERFVAYGALFVGSGSAEAFGDYGAGPNHVLPTAGTARFSSGLSVFSFLTVRTFQRIERRDETLARDCIVLAGLEGLDGHALAAAYRDSEDSCFSNLSLK